MTSLNKITIHWTAGYYFPTFHEQSSYHFLVKDDGKIVYGYNSPEANLNCKDGNYAAHTGGGNTGNIGVAMCAMAGFKDKNNPGKYPITKVQFEACMKLVAELCIKYGIPVTSQTVFTHYEFGLRNPKTSSKGKIDIIHIPPYPFVTASECGQFIRSKVKWYIERLKNENTNNQESRQNNEMV